MQEVAFQEKLKAGSLVENQKRQIREREVLKESCYSRRKKTEKCSWALLSNMHKSKYIKKQSKRRSLQLQNISREKPERERQAEGSK